jgi:multiple antibiotic resistance protein
MSDYIALGILYFTSFFTLINPLGLMPVFIGMTADLQQAERVKIAKKASLVAFIALIAFALLGQLVFKFFGISVAGFRIAGGIIFFLVGYDMLQARLGKIKYNPKQDKIDASEEDISVTPLAIPMITGPGAITNSIVLMEDSHTLTVKIILIISIVLNMIATYLFLVGSAKISKFLGPTVNKVLIKLMGLIVMVIAVEFFFAGLKPYLQDILFNHP